MAHDFERPLHSCQIFLGTSLDVIGHDTINSRVAEPAFLEGFQRLKLLRKHARQGQPDRRKDTNVEAVKGAWVDVLDIRQRSRAQPVL